MLKPQSKVYQWLYHRLFKPSKKPSLGHLMDLYAGMKKDVFFIQIGANEGMTDDPIFRQVKLKGWNGILVEPFEDAFQQLQLNYRQNRDIKFEQSAIAENRERKPFFYVHRKSDAVPAWVSKLNSFDQSITMQVKEEFGDLVEIRSFDMNCITLNDLLDKYDVTQLDLLFTDTEGHDYNILNSIDFERIKPEVIMYEHRHMNQTQRDQLHLMFEKQGYRIFEDPYDSAAVRIPEIIKMYAPYLKN